MTYRTATADQKAAYKGVYKLHGFLTLDSGEVCAVEDLREWGRDNPQWEVRAPAGYHFWGYTTHGRLLYTLAEVRAERLATLVKCVPGGACGCIPARRAHVIKRDTSSAVWAPLYLRAGVWRTELAEASVILDGELAEIATAQECAHEAERALRYALKDGACLAAVARLAEANERAQSAAKQAREAVNALQSAAVELLKSETEGMR